MLLCVALTPGQTRAATLEPPQHEQVALDAAGLAEGEVQTTLALTLALTPTLNLSGPASVAPPILRTRGW